MQVPKPPPLPVYDPERDGNPFWFIVKHAPIVRAQRNGTLALLRADQRARTWIANRALGSK
jgi:hypothetical protein